MGRVIALLSCRKMPAAEALEKLGFDVILTTPYPFLDPRISCHADMTLTQIRDSLVIAPFSDLFGKLEARGIKTVIGTRVPGRRYPEDCPYNVAVGESIAIFSRRTVDPTVLGLIEMAGMETIEVRQGYSRCATLIAKDVVLTSDPLTHRRATRRGIPSLFVDPRPIVLEGYGHGFIGGASGYISGTVFFVGSLKIHPQFEEIRSFLGRHKIDVCELCDGPLTDIGGIFFIAR